MTNKVEGCKLSHVRVECDPTKEMRGEDLSTGGQCRARPHIGHQRVSHLCTASQEAPGGLDPSL